MARQKGLSFYKKKKTIDGNVVREVFGYIFGIVASVFIAAVLIYMMGISTSVIGNSMEPELTSGQVVLIDKFTYMFSQPQIGDVIVFLPNGNENSHYYVKRVVAAAGDTICIENGKIIVNGKPLSESISRDKIAEAGIASETITLKVDECFVLGDNTNNSEDSRSANIGVVKKDYVVGKAWYKQKKNGDNGGFIK